jgi:putative acetyltransferase
VIDIRPDDLSDGKVISLLELHRLEMFKHSPPQSVHALDVAAMHHPDLSFYSALLNGQFAACGALKHHDAHLAEIKSMKTKDEYLRLGVASGMLDFMINKAVERGYSTLCLETGSMNAFIPARQLYARAGFTLCEPFAGYVSGPHSVYMALEL